MEAFAYLQSVLWYESDLFTSAVYSHHPVSNASGTQQKQKQASVVEPERHLQELESTIYLMMP